MNNLPQSQYLQFDNGRVKMEANYSPEVIPCKEIKITIGEKEAVVTREEFFSLLMAFADEKQMEMLAVHTSIDLVSVERMFKIKANKDMKEGELLVFPFRYFLPRKEYDNLKKNGEMVKMIEHETDKLVKLVSENEAAKEVKKMFRDGKLLTD